MDKQKEIEKMAADLDKAKELALGTVGSLNNGFGGWYAKCLVEKGYGDVRAAVKEFADKVLSKIYSALDYCPNDYEEAYHECFSDLRDYINDLVKEMCGDEVSKNDKEMG